MARSIFGLALAKDGFSCRCCRVVLRRDDVRLGTAVRCSGNPCISASVAVSSIGESPEPFNAASWSNMLKSGLNVPPCKLRRFLDGLPKLAWSKFMIPSLRFSGLDFTPQLFPFSNLAVARAGANGLGFSVVAVLLKAASVMEWSPGLEPRSTRFS